METRRYWDDFIRRSYPLNGNYEVQIKINGKLYGIHFQYFGDEPEVYGEGGLTSPSVPDEYEIIRVYELKEDTTADTTFICEYYEEIHNAIGGKIKEIKWIRKVL